MGSKIENTRFIDKISDKDLQELLVMISGVIPNVDVEKLYRIASKAGRNKKQYTVDDEYYSLLERWVETGRKDYSVYEEKLYLIDAWVSWRVYSRMQVYYMNRRFNELKSLINLDDISTIVDLGAGIGYSTMALNQLFKPKKIYATQIEGTDQYKICKHLFSKVDNAEVIPSVESIDSADIVFASEYFEHFDRPIDHLNEVLKLNPKMLIIANSFGVDDAIGHFVNYYDEKGNCYKGKQISRAFNNKLRESGYTNKMIRFYNNLPAIFIRKDCLLV